MDRRQFLLYQAATSFALPAAAFQQGISIELLANSGPAVHSERTHDLSRVAEQQYPKIGIVSVGGIGYNALPHPEELPSAAISIAIDTHGNALCMTKASRKILVGGSKKQLNLTPHGAGLLACASIREIEAAAYGLDMVLLVVGMGSNTGSGVAPVVAKTLRKMGIFTVGYAVMPYRNEGMQRVQTAQAGMEELRLHVDALLPLHNDDVVDCSTEVEPSVLGFRESGVVGLDRLPSLFREHCRHIINSIFGNSLINIDQADLQYMLLSQPGVSAFGHGAGNGSRGVLEAVNDAVKDPLLCEQRLRQASAVFLSIEDRCASLSLRDVKEATKVVRKLISPDAFFIYGANRVDRANSYFGSDFTVSILASGLPMSRECLHNHHRSAS